MSATEPEARAELIFSSLLASGTHWNSTSMPVWSSRAVITAPCGSGVAGVWKTDIQDSEPSLPPPPSALELPQEDRARAPAAASGPLDRRARRESMRCPFVGSGPVGRARCGGSAVRQAAPHRCGERSGENRRCAEPQDHPGDARRSPTQPPSETGYLARAPARLLLFSHAVKESAVYSRSRP